jgi:hypothetical protein
MLVGQERQDFNNKLLNSISTDTKIKEEIFNQYSQCLLEHGKPLPLTINSLIDPAPLKRYSSQIMPYTKKYWKCWGPESEPEPRNYVCNFIVNTTAGKTFNDLIIPCHSQDSFNEIVNKTKLYNSGIDFSNVSFNTVQTTPIQWNMSTTPLPIPGQNSNSTQNSSQMVNLSINNRRKVFTANLRKKFEKYHWTPVNMLINQCCFMFDFCSSLAILEDSHPFLQMFQKGIWLGDKKSSNRFINHIMNMYYVLFYLNIPIPTNFDEFLPELILDTIECLYIRGMKTNRDDALAQIKNYVNFCVNQRISQELETIEQPFAFDLPENKQIQTYKYPNKYDILKDPSTWENAIRYGNLNKRS